MDDAQAWRTRGTAAAMLLLMLAGLMEIQSVQAGSPAAHAASAPASPLPSPPASAATGAAAAASAGAGAASTAVPQPGYEERVRRCLQHPVRAVREECLKRARQDFGRD